MPTEIKKYACDYCGRHFGDGHMARLHEDMHLSPERIVESRYSDTGDVPYGILIECRGGRQQWYKYTNSPSEEANELLRRRIHQ